MDWTESFFGTFIGLISAGVTFWIAGLFGRPILEFHRLRRDIAAELVFVANIRPKSDEMPSAEALAAMERIRRLGSQLHALDRSLSKIAIWYLKKFRKYDLEGAGSKLIGISNNLGDQLGWRAQFQYDMETALKLPTTYKTRPTPRTPDEPYS